MKPLLLSRRKTVLALFGSYNSNSRKNLSHIIRRGDLSVITAGGKRSYIPVGAVAQFAGVSVDDVQRRIDEGEKDEQKKQSRRIESLEVVEVVRD